MKGCKSMNLMTRKLIVPFILSLANIFTIMIARAPITPMNKAFADRKSTFQPKKLGSEIRLTSTQQCHAFSFVKFSLTIQRDAEI